MARQNLKGELFESLEPRFLGIAFKLDRSVGEFVRKDNGLNNYFTLDCVAQMPGYHIEPIVWLRIDRVEEIFYQGKNWTAQEKRFSRTIGKSLGHIMCSKGRRCEFFLESSSDVPAVCAQLARVFNELASPFFGRWASLNALDAELNDNPNSHSVIQACTQARCTRGIIIAKLVGRPDFDRLSATYSEIIKRDMNGVYREPFAALLRSLDAVEPWSGLPKHLIAPSTSDPSTQAFEMLHVVSPANRPISQAGPSEFRIDDSLKGVTGMKYDDASWHYGGDFPKNRPIEAAATHTGMFVAWALLSGLGGDLHFTDLPEKFRELSARAVTPGAFFWDACAGKFTDEDLNDEGNAFARDYYELETGQFLQDYATTLGGDLPDLYHVEDTWENYDLLKPVIDERFREWIGGEGKERPEAN